jgi:trimeric autotransporter adhesin
MPRLPALPFLLLLCATTLLAPARAQCQWQWLPGDGVPGVIGRVHALCWWDPDGAGPGGQRLVVGGTFSHAGTTVARNLSALDPATGDWIPLASSFTPFQPSQGTSVSALAALPNGDLLVGGSFIAVNGAPATGLARLRNGVWSSAAPPLTGPARAIASLPNGDIVVGGEIYAGTTLPANHLLRLSGASWVALGSGVNAPVSALQVAANGDLVVAGAFSTAGGVAAAGIARWNGTVWSSIGSGAGTGAAVSRLARSRQGDLVMASSGSLGVARWTGSSWVSLGLPIGPGLPTVSTMHRQPNGDLVIGGAFLSVSGVPAQRLARWNGQSWSAFGGGTNGRVEALATAANGDLVAGGDFDVADGRNAHSLVRWDGTRLRPLVRGFNGTIASMVTLSNGDVVVGGSFNQAGDAAANRIARWDGASWSPVGAGFDGIGFFGIVSALAVLPNGELVAGGSMTTSAGQPVNSLARWDGQTWQPLGGGCDGSVNWMSVLPSGDLVVVGSFANVGATPAARIARWDGTSWSPYGSGLTGYAGTACVDGQGGIVVGGDLTNAGGQPVAGIARWHAGTWSALGTGLNGLVRALATLPNGDVMALGSFTTAGGIATNGAARWNGTSWAPVPRPPNVYIGERLMPLPNGDLAHFGQLFYSPSQLPNGARWDGTSWTPLATIEGVVLALATRADGTIVCGGGFVSTPLGVSMSFARAVSTCPPATVASGAGCAGSSGPNTLRAATAPWTGSHFRTVAGGLPIGAIAVLATGFAPTSLPLASVFPAAGANCSVLVAPAFIDLQLATAGEVGSSLFLPNTPLLAGATLLQQAFALELDAQGGIATATSSNALNVTIGTL